MDKAYNTSDTLKILTRMRMLYSASNSWLTLANTPTSATFLQDVTLFHPATQMLANKAGPSATVNNGVMSPSSTMKETNPIFKALASATGRGKEREKATASVTPIQGSIQTWSFTRAYLGH